MKTFVLKLRTLVWTKPYTFAIATALSASPERVWGHASSFAGVNRELWPLARMTYPAAMKRLTPDTVPLARVAFHSWILLLIWCRARRRRRHPPRLVAAVAELGSFGGGGAGYGYDEVRTQPARFTANPSVRLRHVDLPMGG